MYSSLSDIDFLKDLTSHMQKLSKIKQKKMSSKPTVPVSVNGVTKAREITNLFEIRFKVNPPPLVGKTEEGVNDENIVTGDPVRITLEDEKFLLKSMTRGESPGHDSLSVEHLRNAGPHLPRVLALCILFVSGTVTCPRN